MVAEIEKQPQDPKKVILDVDLDYFGPQRRDGKWEGEEIEKIRALLSCAGVITFAISPGFLDEQRAIDLVKRILSNEVKK